MIGAHQFCVCPVRAGTTLPSDYLIHIPHEQTMVFCITTNGFRCCCCTWIDGIRVSTPSLPETFIRTGRGSQKNRYVRKTVVQQFHQFIHLIVVHIYIITPVMAFIGSEYKKQHRKFLSNGHRWFEGRYAHVHGCRQYERYGLYLRRVRHVPDGDVQRREPAEQYCQ